MNKNKFEKILVILFFIIIIFVGLYIKTAQENNVVKDNRNSYEISNIPEYSEDIYVLINNNIPKFSEDDIQIDEYYSNLENGRIRNGYDKN